MSHGSPVHHENGLSCGPAVGLGDVGILLVPRESVLSLTRELPVPRTFAPSTPSRIAAKEAFLGRAGGGAPGLSPRRLRSRLLAPRGARPLPPPLRGCSPRGHLAGQALPEAGGGLPLLRPLRGVVPRRPAREPRPAAAPAPAAAASVRPRRAGYSCRRTADRSASETRLLCGAGSLEIVAACAWW